MKLFVWVVIALSMILAGCQRGDQALTPKTQDEKYAYSVGSSMAKMHKRTLERIKDVESGFNTDMYIQGINDSIRGNPQFTEEEVQQLSDEYHKLFMEKSNAKNEKIAADNLAAAKRFFSENKSREGVVETASGLQYKIITEGSGRKPTKDDRVEVNYIGRLIDGAKFDSSYDLGKPAQFDLIRVVPGWTEGLQLMQEGSKYELYVPPELGYGMRTSAKIPGNSALIFEVELLKVLEKGKKSN